MGRADPAQGPDRPHPDLGGRVALEQEDEGGNAVDDLQPAQQLDGEGPGRLGGVLQARLQQGDRPVPDLLDGVGGGVDGQRVGPGHGPQEGGNPGGLADPADGPGRGLADHGAGVVEEREKIEDGERGADVAQGLAGGGPGRGPPAAALVLGRLGRALALEQPGQGLAVLAPQGGKEGAGLGLEQFAAGGGEVVGDGGRLGGLVERAVQRGPDGGLLLGPRSRFQRLTPDQAVQVAHPRRRPQTMAAAKPSVAINAVPRPATAGLPPGAASPGG